jgi:hypothetical protein
MKNLKDENRRLRNNLEAKLHVLECIANMQITESTNTSEVLGLCMSMARLEMEKSRKENQITE